MYYKRHIDRYLQEWKNSPRLKPLLLRGARQVGKSWSLRHLGESFEHFAEINFELQPEFKVIFKELSDVKEIISRISTLLNVPIIEGKTLLFLDEIQSCPEALHCLWSFKENMPKLHVAAAGSLLEFTLKEMPSFGVGRIRSMFMYPMSFDEFLSTVGRDSWIEAKKGADYQQPVPTELHDALVQQFRSFLMVGGMPSSVSAWVETHDYNECALEQEDLQQSYYDDFVKYSKKVDPMLLRNTLRSVIAQTGDKFVYSRVEGGYRIEEVKKALTMLCDAGIVKLVQHSAANGVPLGAEVNDKFRKYNYLDSGLMLRILDLELGGAQVVTELILTGAGHDLVNKGPITEMVAGWEMIKNLPPRTSHDLYYWENLSEGTTSEVDYLIARDMTVHPVEVKSEVTGKMKSLRAFMQKKHLLRAFRCSLENFGTIEFIDKEDTKYPTATKHIFIHPLYNLASLVAEPLAKP